MRSLQNGNFEQPRKGKNNDKAHPPIHPTAHCHNLVGDEKKVYDYITRRFLACCSKDAQGMETTVRLKMGDETFHTTGLSCFNDPKHTNSLMPLSNEQVSEFFRGISSRYTHMKSGRTRSCQSTEKGKSSSLLLVY